MSSIAVLTQEQPFPAAGLMYNTTASDTLVDIIPFSAAGQIVISQASGDPVAQTVSGSGATITLSASGVLTISGIANASLANSSLTVTAGTGLSGGGSVSLGSSVTISHGSPGSTTTTVNNPTQLTFDADGHLTGATGSPGHGYGPAPTTAPTLTATPGNTTVALSWTTATGATSYDLYRYSSSSGTPATGTLIFNGSGTSFTDTGRINGTTYYYQAFPINNSVYGTGSNVASATPTGDYLYDTFTDTNGTAAASHKMDIGPGGVPNITGWSNTGGGTFQIGVSGTRMVFIPNATSDGHLVADAQHSDGTITCTINLGSDVAHGMGIWFRATDDNNAWLFDIATGGGAGGLHLFKVSSGTYTSVASDNTLTLATNTDYSVTVVLSGSSISCSISGHTLSTTDSYLATNTKMGLKGATASTSTYQDWDNFQMTP